MTDLLKCAVYVKYDGREEPHMVKAMNDWLEPYDHRIMGHTYNWRKLEGWQCSALHGYLEGAWLKILRMNHQGGLINYDDYDPDVVMMFKLAWGGK